MAKPLMCPPALLQRSLSGKTVIITGSNSGIGFVTAKQLAKQGAHVVIACRRQEAGEKAVQDITAEVSDAKVEFMLLDFRFTFWAKDSHFLAATAGPHSVK